MAELQCKICGKNLDITTDKPVMKHVCGAEIVVPSNLTDNRIEMFNSAYKFLRTLDFKKAEAVFNKILSSSDRKDYEVHWGLALCEFKIEHYNNPVSKTIEIYSHYSGNEVFTECQHYKSAVRYARVAVRKIYAEVGAIIDNVLLTKKQTNEKKHNAYNLLSQGNFEGAEKIFNDIIDKSPREPMAYIGKLLCELNFTEISQLADSEISLSQFKNYNNAIQCADRETKVFLNAYNMAVSERLNQEDFFPDEEAIHTLDEMEINAEDTFEITSTDKFMGFLYGLKYRFLDFRMFLSEHSGAVKAALISLGVLFILGIAALVLAFTVFAPTDYYKVGSEILENGNIVEAAENLALAKNEPDAVSLLKSEKFIEEVHHLYNTGKVREAIRLANLCGITTTKIEKLDMLINETVSCGENHSLAITKNKTVVASNTSNLINYGECNIASWTDVISVSAGTFHSVGLKEDGTVLFAGDNRFGQGLVEEWENIIAVSAGGRHTVGLKSNGTVVATEYLGENNNGQSDVSAWKNVIAISAGDDYTVGLLSNSTVISTKKINGIEKWKNIIAISAGTNNLLALTADGKVLSAKIDGDFVQNDYSVWSDIVKISAGNRHSLGLQADGKLLSTKHINTNDDQTKIDNWDNIIAFSAGLDSSVGLTEKYEFISTQKTNVKAWKY